MSEVKGTKERKQSGLTENKEGRKVRMITGEWQST